MRPHSRQSSEPTRSVNGLVEQDGKTAVPATTQSAIPNARARGRARCTDAHYGSAPRPSDASRTLTPVFRLSARADPAFLAEMLYEAVNWRDDGAEERPPLNEMLAQPELRRYVEGWGRVGDVAIVALDRRDEPVGAAWYRLFSADEPGYGFVDADTPELSIALYPECRRQHVGALLLSTLLQHARSNGLRAMSLSVARENPARGLYARHGFEVVGESGDSLTMVVDLT